MDKYAVHIKVSGKVQGVFYRQSTCKKAISLSLTGWVKNNKDGTVEIEAEGEKLSLEELIDWCKRGPENAIVTGIEQYEIQPSGHSGFRIIR